MSKLQFALNLAKRAGDILIDNYGKSNKIIQKGKKDYATNVDIEVEKLIVKEIEKQYPDHSIVGEELGNKKRSSQYTWYIDPLDGTKNYFNKIPLFGVSIALAKNNKLVLGVINLPALNELYYAEEGSGAYLNDKKIIISNKKDFEECILGSNPGYARSKYESAIYRAIARKVSSTRIFGCATVDLCFLASGKIDIYMNSLLNPWDFAAGVLIAKEAGAEITTNKGNQIELHKTDIILANKHLHQEVLKIISMFNH